MTEMPIEYGALVRDLHSRAAMLLQPVGGTFELTARCNLSCKMCYIRHNSGDATKEITELPASAWVDLARQAKNNGMVFLLLTGGEVFLRRDFFDIFEPLTRMGLMLCLFTNGTLITKELAQRLAKAPPSWTEISLYGASAPVYEAITGIPGSFAACCAGIEALVSQRVPLGLKTTITRQNVHELEAMRQMAHDWGLPFIGAWMLIKRRDGRPSNVDNCRLSALDCVALEASDSVSAHEWSEAALREGTTDQADNFCCLAGKASFAVGPSGDMNPCVSLAVPAARPIENGFQAAWKQVVKYVRSVPPPSAVCLSCGSRFYCARCPAWSLTETGTLTEPVPYCCDIARARKVFYHGRV
jgi:radical SAM protein with 4Fe4S-binding SPASM domain